MEIDSITSSNVINSEFNYFFKICFGLLIDLTGCYIIHALGVSNLGTTRLPLVAATMQFHQPWAHWTKRLHDF